MNKQRRAPSTTIISSKSNSGRDEWEGVVLSKNRRILWAPKGAPTLELRKAPVPLIHPIDSSSLDHPRSKDNGSKERRAKGKMVSSNGEGTDPPRLLKRTSQW